MFILLCSWMMDATLLDVGTGIKGMNPRNNAGPHDAYASNVSGHSFSNTINSSSSDLLEHTDTADTEVDSPSRKSDITTLLLLGYGILGIVGFWRQVMR